MPPKFKKTFSFEDVHIGRAEETEGLLGHQSGSDEDFILQGPSNQPAGVHSENDKIKQMREQVAEVTEIMRDNVVKVMDRGIQLDDLQEKSERLNLASADFHVATARVRRRAWMQHLKMRVMLVGVVAIFIVGITVFIIVHFTSGSTEEGS